MKKKKKISQNGPSKTFVFVANTFSVSGPHIYIYNRANKVFKFVLKHVCGFSPRWVLGDPRQLKNVIVGHGNNFHYRELHSENCHAVYFLAYQLDSQFPTTNACAMAPCLSLTHPERCATKFCARKCQRFLRICHLRPNHYISVVPKCLPNCP